MDDNCETKEDTNDGTMGVPSDSVLLSEVGIAESETVGVDASVG